MLSNPSRRRFLFRASGLSLALVLPWLSAGCKTLSDLAAGTVKPGVSVKGVRFGALSADGLTLLFDAEVTNPYEVDLPLVNLDYGLASGGAKFLTGSAPIQGSVPAKGSKMVELPAAVSFAPLLKAVSGVKPGAVVPYTADLKVSVEVPKVAGGGRLALPMSKSGELPVPAVPEVSISNLKLGQVGLSKALATVSLNVKNTNSFAADLSRFDLGLDLTGTRVASVSAARPLSLAPGAAGTIDIPIEISVTKLGLAAFNALRGKDAGYRLTGETAFQTPFGPITMPLDRSGTTKVSS